MASDLYLTRTADAAVSTPSNAKISEEAESKVSVVPYADISWTSNGGISEETEAKISVVPNTDISWTSYSEVSKSNGYSHIVPLSVSVLMVSVASIPLDSHLDFTLEWRCNKAMIKWRVKVKLVRSSVLDVRK